MKKRKQTRRNAAERPASPRPTVTGGLDRARAFGWRNRRDWTDVGIVVGVALVSEPLNLRIKDVDLEAHRLCIRGAKGGYDRVVPLPSCLAPEIIQQMQSARLVWQQDKQNAHALDAASWAGQEVSRIPVQLGVGLAVPRPSSVPRPSNGGNCPLPYA